MARCGRVVCWRISWFSSNRDTNVDQFPLKVFQEGNLSPHPYIGAKSDFYLRYYLGALRSLLPTEGATLILYHRSFTQGSRNVRTSGIRTNTTIYILTFNTLNLMKLMS
ncbi:hypothetical protein AVEN_258762-1 [Araneus ventricosus]|uniref:Uncharacterized protein n=1 Tax=Araneus ventricosus TaxID=182803 RepID=A0A4Y2D0D5_ARAVE|nr:hypothetical protein AVEN_258762-1 [Araneus ventricosus]